MRGIAKALFAIGAVLFQQTAAVAQYGPGGPVIIPPGAMVIDGYPVACGGVPTTLVATLHDVAIATPNGIILNWPVFSGLPTGVKAFIYAHECGHMLGGDENQADAFAIKLGRNQGWINPFILNQICASVYMSQGDWTHLPGPARCSMMLNYFQN